MNVRNRTRLSLRQISDLRAQEHHDDEWKPHRNELLDNFARDYWLGWFDDCEVAPDAEDAEEHGIGWDSPPSSFQESMPREHLYRLTSRGSAWVPDEIGELRTLPEADERGFALLARIDPRDYAPLLQLVERRPLGRTTFKGWAVSHESSLSSPAASWPTFVRSTSSACWSRASTTSRISSWRH